MRRESSSDPQLTVIVPPPSVVSPGLSISVQDVDDASPLLRIQLTTSGEDGPPPSRSGAVGVGGSGHVDGIASQRGRHSGGGPAGLGRMSSIRSPLRSPMPKRGGLPGFDSWNTATTSTVMDEIDATQTDAVGDNDGGRGDRQIVRGSAAWPRSKEEGGTLSPSPVASSHGGDDVVQDAVVAMHASSPLVVPGRRRLSAANTTTNSSDVCSDHTTPVPGSPQFNTLVGCTSPMMVTTPAATQQRLGGSRRSFPSTGGDNSLPSSPTMPPRGGGGSTAQPPLPLEPVDHATRRSSKASPHLEHVRSPLLDAVRSPKAGGRHRLPSPRAFMELDPAHRLSVVLPKALASQGTNNTSNPTICSSAVNALLSGGQHSVAVDDVATQRLPSGEHPAHSGFPVPGSNASAVLGTPRGKLSPHRSPPTSGMEDLLEKEKHVSGEYEADVEQQEEQQGGEPFLQDPTECLLKVTQSRRGVPLHHRIVGCLAAPLLTVALTIAGLVIVLVVVGTRVDDLRRVENARYTQSGLAYVSTNMRSLHYEVTLLAERLVRLYEAVGIAADGNITAPVVPPMSPFNSSVNGSTNLWDGTAAAANGTTPTSVVLDLCSPLRNGVVGVASYNASGHRLHMLRCYDRVYGGSSSSSAATGSEQQLFRVLDDDALPLRIGAATTAVSVGMHWGPSTANNVVLSSGAVNAGGVALTIRVVVASSVARRMLFGASQSVTGDLKVALFVPTTSASSSDGAIALALAQDDLNSNAVAAFLESGLTTHCGGGSADTTTWTHVYANVSSITAAAPLDVAAPVYTFAASAALPSNTNRMMCASFCHALIANNSTIVSTGVNEEYQVPLQAIGCPDIAANAVRDATAILRTVSSSDGTTVLGETQVVFPVRTTVYVVAYNDPSRTDHDAARILASLQAITIPLMVLVLVGHALHYTSVAVPAMLLTRRMHAIVSGQRWRLRTHERWLASWTQPLWLRDMQTLMRSYQIVAACFALNQFYVPDFILEQQLKKLTDPAVLDSILVEEEPWNDPGVAGDDASTASGVGATKDGGGLDEIEAMEGEEERLVESLGATLNPLLAPPSNVMHTDSMGDQLHQPSTGGSLPNAELIGDALCRSASFGLGGSGGRVSHNMDYLPPYYAHRLPPGAPTPPGEADGTTQTRRYSNNNNVDAGAAALTVAVDNNGSEATDKANGSTTSTTSSRRSHRLDGGGGINAGASGTLLRPTTGYADHTHNSVPASRRVSLFAVPVSSTTSAHVKRGVGGSSTLDAPAGGGGGGSSSAIMGRMVMGSSSTNVVTIAPPHHQQQHLHNSGSGNSGGLPPMAKHQHPRAVTPQHNPSTSSPQPWSTAASPHHGGQHAATPSAPPSAGTTLGRVLLSQNMVLQDNATIVVVTLRAVEEAYRADFFVTEQQHRKILMTINSVIRRHKGEVFERTGERVSVAWNAFEARADHAVRAVRCATDIAALFRQFRRDGLRMGIVVHQGPVVCGIVGDHREAASVLFGQTADHTVRLAALAAQLPYFNVLVTEPVKKAVSIFFECVIVDVVRDREIDAPLAIFDVRQELNATKAATRGQQQSSSAFVVGCATAFAHFRAHQFQEAQAQLRGLEDTASTADDLLVGRLSALCTYYDAHREELPRPYCRWLPRWDIFEYPADPICAAFNGFETVDGNSGGAAAGDVPSSRFATYLVSHMRAVARTTGGGAVAMDGGSTSATDSGDVVGSRKISNATTMSSSSFGVVGALGVVGGTERSTSIAVFQEKLARVNSGAALGQARATVKGMGPPPSNTATSSRTRLDGSHNGCELPQFDPFAITSLDRSKQQSVVGGSGVSGAQVSALVGDTGLKTTPPSQHNTAAAAPVTMAGILQVMAPPPGAAPPPINGAAATAGCTSSGVFRHSLVESMFWSTSLVGGGGTQQQHPQHNNASALFLPTGEGSGVAGAASTSSLRGQLIVRTDAIHSSHSTARSSPPATTDSMRLGSGRGSQPFQDTAALPRNHSFSATQHSSLVGIPSQNFSRGSNDEATKQLRVLPTRIESAHGSTYVRSTRILGTGSFGCVYLGMEQHTGRLVAMKFLPLPSDEAEVRVLQNEVVTMETVADANLVEFYGYAFVDNMIVLMMECLVAGSLAGMLTTFAALPEQTTINFVRDVLRGLHRLHSMGIVHRDVKPQNVLIAANGHCKISDFGASASIHELVRRHDGGAEVQGTPIYLAPEAARGHAEPKSDVWSVGIMYLQLTTGSIPYEPSAMAAGIGAVVFGIGSGRLRPTIPDDLSPLARAFVEGCLADDVKQRLSAEELLKLPLFRSPK